MMVILFFLFFFFYVLDRATTTTVPPDRFCNVEGHGPMSTVHQQSPDCGVSFFLRTIVHDQNDRHSSFFYFFFS